MIILNVLFKLNLMKYVFKTFAIDLNFIKYLEKTLFVQQKYDYEYQFKETLIFDMNKVKSINKSSNSLKY